MFGDCSCRAFARVRDVLDLIRGQGSTALYDAAYAGLALPDRGARSVVVLFSDGEDNASWLTAEEVRSVAARSDVLLQAVGITDTIQIGDTICDINTPEALPRIEVDPPTVSVRFSVNTSPFAGKDGRFITSRQIGERLHRETLGNVSIDVSPADTPDTFIVSGRGELQIAILIETLNGLFIRLPPLPGFPTGESQATGLRRP